MGTKLLLGFGGTVIQVVVHLRIKWVLSTHRLDRHSELELRFFWHTDERGFRSGYRGSGGDARLF